MARAADYEMVQFMLANVIGRFPFVAVLYALLYVVSEDVLVYFASNKLEYTILFSLSYCACRIIS